MFKKQIKTVAALSVICGLLVATSPSGFAELPANWTVSAEKEYNFESDMSIAIAYHFLMEEMQLNQAVAAGVIANFITESGIRTTALGDGGTSYGICQWHNERWSELISFAESHGKPMEDIETQLNFFKYEILTKYQTMYQKWLELPNDDDGAYQAAYTMCLDFERPQGGESSANSRGHTAISTLNKAIPSYQYSYTLMQILYMESIYAKNYQSPIVKVSGNTIIPIAQDTYIPVYQETQMSYDNGYWEYMENGGHENSLPEWIQLENIDDFNIEDTPTFTDQILAHEQTDDNIIEENQSCSQVEIPNEQSCEEIPQQPSEQVSESENISADVNAELFEEPSQSLENTDE